MTPTHYIFAKNLHITERLKNPNPITPIVAFLATILPTVAERKRDKNKSKNLIIH